MTTLPETFTRATLERLSDADFDALVKDVKARRKVLAARSESAQREAKKAAERLVTPPKVLAGREEWARRNVGEW